MILRRFLSWLEVALFVATCIASIYDHHIAEAACGLGLFVVVLVNNHLLFRGYGVW